MNEKDQWVYEVKKGGIDSVKISSKDWFENDFDHINWQGITVKAFSEKNQNEIQQIYKNLLYERTKDTFFIL